MNQITNEQEFKQSLADLPFPQQRLLAGRFVENVVSLSNDERIPRALQVLRNPDASQDELAQALKSAKAATFDCHTRCGAEGDWKEQAGYFVARATVAALTPQEQSKAGGPGWQAAMSCRMARTSMAIDATEITPGDENQQQYRIVSDYLKSQ